MIVIFCWGMEDNLQKEIGGASEDTVIYCFLCSGLTTLVCVYFGKIHQAVQLGSCELFYMHVMSLLLMSGYFRSVCEMGPCGRTSFLSTMNISHCVATSQWILSTLGGYQYQAFLYISSVEKLYVFLLGLYLGADWLGHSRHICSVLVDVTSYLTWSY